MDFNTIYDIFESINKDYVEPWEMAELYKGEEDYNENEYNDYGESYKGL